MEYTRENYNNLLEEIFSKHPTVQNSGFNQGSYKPGLQGMERFDRALGNPSEGFASIHVAGTNGKGSVSSFLAAALASTGRKVGLYTSPHLTDFRERIKIIENGSFSMIPREEVFRFVTGNDLEGLSFFEITTGMAFRWFADRKVDIAVIETGLGGRLDSTNILNPELTVITSIGLDHCALLGNSRSLIAAEKAGIFKPGVPALIATRDNETLGVFEQKAAEVHCPIFFAEDFATEDISLDLEGPYQQQNLRTALAALELLGEELDDAMTDAISHAASVTGLRGRWEKLSDNPLTICDIGHNPPALEINFRKLADCGKKLFIVFGVMKDKDLDGIRPLMPVDAAYYLVAPCGERAMDAGTLASRLPGLDTRVCASVSEGVSLAMKDASETPDSIVYIGGSNFVVAEAIPFIENRL